MTRFCIVCGTRREIQFIEGAKESMYCGGNCRQRAFLQRKENPVARAPRGSVMQQRKLEAWRERQREMMAKVEEERG